MYILYSEQSKLVQQRQRRKKKSISFFLDKTFSPLHIRKNNWKNKAPSRLSKPLGVVRLVQSASSIFPVFPSTRNFPTRLGDPSLPLVRFINLEKKPGRKTFLDKNQNFPTFPSGTRSGRRVGQFHHSKSRLSVRDSTFLGFEEHNRQVRWNIFFSLSFDCMKKKQTVPDVLEMDFVAETRFSERNFLVEELLG